LSVSLEEWFFVPMSTIPGHSVAAERGRDGRVLELIGSAVQHRDRRADAAGPAMGDE
jgi:hypothetical protein